MPRIGLGARYLRTVCVLRAKGVRHGRHPVFFGGLPIIEAAGEISIGDNFKAWSHHHRVVLGTGPDGRLRIGDRVAMNHGANVFASTLVEIGDNVRLGDLSAVYDTDFHEVEPAGGVRRDPVRLGRNVWLGRGAVVLPGVTIGENSVIAAGAVVTRDVPANALAAGVPAGVVRRLECPPGYVRP